MVAYVDILFVLRDLEKNFVNCPYTKLRTKESIQCIMDEKSKQEKNEKNTRASIFVFSVSCLVNGIKICELGIVQMLENKDFTNVPFLRVT